ncbi:MAG: hypothetical protein ACE5LU_09425 [Anaerolineae bacterium]
MTLGSLSGARAALFIFSFLAAPVVSVVVFRYAAAQQPAPPTIGEPFGVFAGPGAQRGPAIAFDEGARRHLIVWSDITAGDIYGRVVADHGSPVGPHFPISLAPGTQISPTVAAGGPGQGFLVVWQDARNGDWDIYGQRISAAGRLLDGQGAVDADPTANTALITGPGDQHMPDVAYSPQADFYLVVWGGSLPEPDVGVEVAGRLISSTGVPIGESVTIIEDPRAVAHPAVTYNPTAGEFLVVWQRQDIWVEDRRLSAMGELQGQRRQIWSSLIRPYPAPIPDVIYNPVTEEYLAVWDDASDENIYGFRVLSDGQPEGDRIPISSAAGLQVGPRVGTHGAGYLVAWADSRDPDSRQIYGQLLSAGGERVNEEGTPGAPADVNMPLATAIPDQESPALAFNPDGVEYLLTWAEDRLEGPDILGERIWFPAMGPRPTPTPTLTPTASATPTATMTPTTTPTPTPTQPHRYLVLVFRNWPEE